MDKYLKFDSEAAAQAVLYTEVPAQWDEEGNVTATEPKANFANIDVIGTIFEGGAWDAEGNQITAPTALPGWHVNVRLAGEDGSALEAYAVEVNSPVRVWA